MTTTTVPPPYVQAVFRGVSEHDCVSQAERDATAARSNGYEVHSQFWTDETGARVLTVTYRYTGVRAEPPPAATPSTARQPVGPALAIAGGSLVILGAFLPWITASAAFASVSRAGMDGSDGMYFVIGGAIAIGLGVIGLVSDARQYAGLLLLAGILGLAGTFLEWRDISERLADLSENVVGSFGIGIGAIGLGSGLVLFGGIASERT